MQLTLVRDETKKKEIIYVPKDKLTVSPFNPRRNRNAADIEKLAQRIERNGFEITRALWVCPVNSHYEVFAGGNRLEAVKRTSIDQVPVVLHDGYTEDEITRLADEDNENDEYHTPVSVVDIWMDYKRLSDAGWTQQRIADAKDVSRETVKFRLAYAALPQNIMEIFGKNEFLKESHAAQICNLVNFTNLSPWLNRDALLMEIVKLVLDKQKKNVIAQHFKEAVDAMNDVIKHGEKIAGNLKTITLYDGDNTSLWDTSAHFLAEAAQVKARDIPTLNRILHTINARIAENDRNHAAYMAQKAAESERAALASQPLEPKTGEWWKLGNHLLYCGDTSKPEFYEQISSSAFAFADPPYNAEVEEWDKDFVWNHDWLIDKSPIVAVTPGIASLKNFLCKTTMPYQWSMPCIINNGMTRGPLGFGNWICITLFATASLHRNAQDFIEVSISANGEKGRFAGFKGRKPPALITKLIELFTKRGQTVIDPFLGSATTLFVAEETGRICIGGEIDQDRCRLILEEWQDRTGIRPEKIS